MDSFKSHEICKCCLTLFTGEPVMLTSSIVSKFFDLTQISLHWTPDSCICSFCDSKLSDFHDFRSQLRRLHNENFMKIEPLLILKTETDDDSNNVPVKREFHSESETAEVSTDCSLDTIKKFRRRTRAKSQTNPGSTRCHQCNKDYKSGMSLRKHIRKVHEKLPKKPPEENLCSICAKIVKGGKSHLDKHVLLVHSQEYNFRCDLCSYKSKTRSSLASHMKCHMLDDSREQFVCSLCPASFKEKYRLDGHVFRIHVDAPKNFLCDCGKAFKSKKYLNHHQYKVHKIGHFPCSQCPGRVFLTKARLNAHVSDFHAEMKPCEICGKMVGGGRKMTIHMRIHGKPAFKCTHDNCTKEFYGKQALQDHIAIKHDGSKSFICPTCGSAFATLKTLRKHISRQHLAEKISCGVSDCKYSTTRKDYLAAHYRSHKDVDDATRNSLIAGIKDIQGMGW